THKLVKHSVAIALYFEAEDGIRDRNVTGVQTCALPILIGSFIKIPAVVGSIPLDAFPALLAVVLIGTTAGAVVAGMGHMVSAYIGGMTLGPLHIIVAMGMALIVWVFGVIYK